jgi:ACS family tartrate transporter-like MFS transporter
MLMIALTLATIGISSMSAAFFQIPTGFLSGTAAAVGIAAINATGNLGGFAGPYAFGLMQGTSNSFFASNVSLAIVLLIGAGLIFLPMLRSRPPLAGPEPVSHVRSVGTIAPAHALLTDSDSTTS